ncbi:MAG: hypothetical protein AAGC43_14145 [Bacteroidota bacterium]
MKKLVYISVFMLGLMWASAQEITDKLTTYINNGQLVIYSESSYLSDNSASAITYVDFCPGGLYHYSYDGSYTVKGTQNTSNRDNRAYGAGVAENSGQWKVLEYQGTHYLEILDAYGKTNYYPINIQNLANGKWKINNVTYVFARGKGRCR